MCKADIKAIETAIDGAFKHGVSDTYELKNGVQFFVSYNQPNTFKLVIFGEYDESITFHSVGAFMRFVS